MSRVSLYVPFTAVAVNFLKTNDADASYVNFFLAQALEPTERAPKPVERAMEGHGRSYRKSLRASEGPQSHLGGYRRVQGGPQREL